MPIDIIQNLKDALFFKFQFANLSSDILALQSRKDEINSKLQKILYNEHSFGIQVDETKIIQLDTKLYKITRMRGSHTIEELTVHKAEDIKPVKTNADNLIPHKKGVKFPEKKQQ